MVDTMKENIMNLYEQNKIKIKESYRILATTHSDSVIISKRFAQSKTNPSLICSA